MIIEKILAKQRSFLASHMLKTPVFIPSGFGCITFCFDDFPRSAIRGAGMLEDAGARGTFYSCLGMTGRDSPSGVLASLDETLDLARRGHDIECHTYDHVNFAYTDTNKAVESCRKNIAAGTRHDLAFRHLAYPQGGMRLSVKRQLKLTYATARSTIHGINRGACDLHCLKANPIYERHDYADSERLIDDAARAGGWLIFYTHDVDDAPSIYGTTSARLKRLIDYSHDRLPILTMQDALAALTEKNRAAA